MPQLDTPHLTITPLTLDRLEAFVRSRAEFEHLIGARVPPAWPLPDFAEILPATLKARRQKPGDALWSGLIIHKADGKLIGDIGFFDGPDARGAVEFGYSIVPAYRRRGYATQAVRAMLDWAFAQPQVRRAVADCRADNIGSIRVLEKAGLRRLYTRPSDEGDLINWEITKIEWMGRFN